MSGGWDAAPAWLRAALACPTCGDGLREVPGGLDCQSCPAVYPQSDPQAIELMPSGWNPDDPTSWVSRQNAMSQAYRELAQDREHSLLAWRSDYGPLAPFLARCAGRVLDVGGGNGIARHWLPQATQYVSLEPDPSWRSQGWASLSDAFPCLGAPPLEVRGVAERMPFRSGCFDAVLSIWSLNHVVDPLGALGGMAHALRPAGRLLLVLDDVPPSWGDLARGTHPARGADRLQLALRKLIAPLKAWPIQSDHLRLAEGALLRRAADVLQLTHRCWTGAYLVLDLERPTLTAPPESRLLR